MGFDVFAAITRGIAMVKQFPVLSVIIALMALSILGMLIYMFTHAHTGIPIAVSKVEPRSFGNYAGFRDENSREDSQIQSYGTVTITNTSTDQKVALDLFLHITTKDPAKKANIKVGADLRNSWGQIYGRDDYASKRLKDRSPDNYFRNPIEIKPNDLVRKELVFLFNFGDTALRDRMTEILAKDWEYNCDLVIHDLISGRSVSIRIPGEYRGN